MAFSIIEILGKVLILFQVLLMIQSAPCSKSSVVTPREVVDKVSKSNLLLVKQNPWQQLHQSLNPRQRRSLNTVFSFHCNWTIEVDDNVDRNPRFLSKAVCKDCQWYCKPVYYEHRVLLRDCPKLRTHKVEIDLWKWETVTLEVAFVYNP